MPPETTYIDTENIKYGKEQNTYEVILLKQLQRCVDYLSMDKVSCYMKKADVYIPIKNLNELIINSVDAFRILMMPFIKDESQLEIVEKDLEKKKEELGEKETMLPGIGKIKVKDVALPDNHPIARAFESYKAERYRELFEYLVKVHNNAKAEIESYSYE